MSAGDQEIAPGQWLGARVILQGVRVSLDLAPLFVIKTHLHRVPVEVKIVMANTAIT
jgi:hypothetical protein